MCKRQGLFNSEKPPEGLIPTGNFSYWKVLVCIFISLNRVTDLLLKQTITG